MAFTSNPKVNISVSPAQLAATVTGRNDLIVGSKPTSGLAVSGDLYEDILGSFTSGEIDLLFGTNTDLRNKIEQFKASNGGYSSLDIIALNEAGGSTAAAGTITFGTGVGVATLAGSLVVSIVDEFQWKKTIAVAVGDTDQDVVDAIVTAFAGASNPNIPILVVEDGVNDYEIDVTSVDKGTIGNYFRLKIEGLVPGLGAISIVQPTGGATDPTGISTVFDSVQSTRFTGINWPQAWIGSITTLQTFLDDRFNSDNAILDGVGFVGLQGTFSSVNASVDALNSQSICPGGNTVNMLQPADWTMIYFQGIRSRRLTDGAPISQYVISNTGPLDSFGGIALASKPYMNTSLARTAVTDPNLLYSSSEQIELETSGFSVFGTNSANNGTITGPMVTTYTTDDAGNPNESFHYLNYVDTASVCREYIFNNLKSRFAQSRLTTGVLVPGRSMDNQESIRATFIKLYRDLAEDYALTVAGSDAVTFFEDNLVVTLDPATRSAVSSFQLPIVTQLGSITVAAQLNFNIQGG